MFPKAATWLSLNSRLAVDRLRAIPKLCIQQLVIHGLIMSLHDKESQIRAVLNFDWEADLGPLIVDRNDIRDYVRSHGLPKKSPKSGEISYQEVDGSWEITYWEKNIDIGTRLFDDELTALEAILDSALPQYARFNPRKLVE